MTTTSNLRELTTHKITKINKFESRMDLCPSLMAIYVGTMGRQDQAPAGAVLWTGDECTGVFVSACDCVSMYVYIVSEATFGWPMAVWRVMANGILCESMFEWKGKYAWRIVYVFMCLVLEIMTITKWCTLKKIPLNLLIVRGFWIELSDPNRI